MTDEMPFDETVIANSKVSQKQDISSDLQDRLIQSILLILSEKWGVGSPGVISEILSGKRELNKRQIRALSKRFGCSPAIFI
jgi:hypothetical protein